MAGARAGALQSHDLGVEFRLFDSLAISGVNGEGRPDLVFGEHVDLRTGEMVPDVLTGVMSNFAVGM